MKIVRERLRTHYSVDMTPHKKLVKKQVLAHDTEAEASHISSLNIISLQHRSNMDTW